MARCGRKSILEKIPVLHRKKIIALSELGFSNVKIAKMYEIDEKSVRNIKKDYTDNLIESSESDDLLAKTRSISEIKEHFAKDCYNKLNLFSDGMTKDKVDKASIKDLAISYGIMYDKMSLAKDMATSNVDVKHSLVTKIRQASNRTAEKTIDAKVVEG